VVTADELAARRVEIAGSADLQALLAGLVARARPVLERLPHIPEEKALLSKDGGVCPADGNALVFDPWSPRAHRCPRCGASYAGARHDGHWARYQHLWLAERAAHLAALAALSDEPAAGARAAEILTAYSERYLGYPNRDNVLGPSRLFFSTYLESLWLCNYLAAAMLLREAGRLDESVARAVTQVADEAANLVGEFDEWFSNRQIWNNAALAAIAAWFEDEDLARRAIVGQTGLVPQLARGFGPDGMWHEGENYHLFALRGWLIGAGWARQVASDLLAEPKVAARLAAALRAPAGSALPDFTYPARKDSRFGVSLAQPAYLELWEVGVARLEKEEEGQGTEEPVSWLSALYRVPAARAELMESYLHDAPIEPVPRPPSRVTLSWWSLLEMLPQLPATPSWSPRSELFETQGLAVLRTRARYASLECGPAGGGHGHADRLHLTLHADGVPWLCDFGTASYVARELFWYRSTLAHNAPRIDGRSQAAGDATCDAFDARDDWAWARGRCGDITRTVVTGPAYVVDLVELAAREEHLLELPWHFTGEGSVETPGTWKADELPDEFVSAVERFEPAAPGPMVLTLAAGGRRLRAHLPSGGALLRAEGPGRPGGAGGRGGRETFFLIRARGRAARLIAVLESVAEETSVRAVRVKGDLIEVETARGVDRHAVQLGGWSIDGPSGAVRLGGRRKPAAPFEPLLEIDRPTKASGNALRVDAPPALDGTLAGFDCGEPLNLDIEDQYRRSEEPYPGPEECSAVACVNWTDDSLYVAVDVTKPDVYFRAPDAPPLLLDNEPDDIHSDGLQVYLQAGAAGAVLGFLIIPVGAQSGPLRVRAVEETAARPELVRGAWQRTAGGYRVTLAIAFSEEARAHPGGTMGFDLIVNEMLPGRARRAGQLVWSGGNGWVWLRGDRQPAARFGVLELIG
jgi:heparinase II/III-like protein/cellulose/xylan binding protein with CBM9 domain